MSFGHELWDTLIIVTAFLQLDIKLHEIIFNGAYLLLDGVGETTLGGNVGHGDLASLAAIQSWE